MIFLVLASTCLASACKSVPARTGFERKSQGIGKAQGNVKQEDTQKEN
jgi:hypothetical protein